MACDKDETMLNCNWCSGFHIANYGGHDGNVEQQGRLALFTYTTCRLLKQTSRSEWCDVLCSLSSEDHESPVVSEIIPTIKLYVSYAIRYTSSPLLWQSERRIKVMQHIWAKWRTSGTWLSPSCILLYGMDFAYDLVSLIGWKLILVVFTWAKSATENADGRERWKSRPQRRWAGEKHVIQT